ncbi:ABC transporter ATP-binding protein [Myxococcota bacterium]|nr:ABC transporter ATP-binding protein [Myxococcota bacterium]
MITVTNVSKFYGSFKALDDVSFTIGRGEVVGFLGPNGAGKTTTLKILTGNAFPHSGTVAIADLDVMDHEQAVKERIGYLPESAPLYRDMLVKEYLAFMAEARGLGPSQKSKAIARVAKDCGIEKMLARPIAHLSKGFRQRVGLAQALLHEPDVLILDEPYTGLDPIQIIEIRNLIKKYGETHTVILSSHILQEVEATCSRILIISEGKIVADGGVSEMLGHNALTVKIAGEDPVIRERVGALEGSEIIHERTWEEGDEHGLELRVKPVGIERDALAASLCELCTQEGWRLYHLGQGKVTFEDLFVAYTKEKIREAKNGR